MRLISQNTIGFALSVAAAYLCVFYLPYRSILYIFISLGQAHFLISYLYTHKAGKINNGYLLKFTASLFLVGFFSFYVFNHTDFFPILIFITLLLFSSHYFNDEFKIGEIGVVSGRLFSQVAVLLAFVALLLSKIFLLQ
ncbi:MAG: hypothetical protein JWQ09_3902, partial [Segetibacter sp.]|nr:hypothetical protein [Segetibacter sp.]